MADSNGSSSSKALKRYGPIAAIVAVIIGAIVIFGGGGDDGGDEEETSGNGGSSSDLPMTFQEAEDEGVDDIEWGDACDTDRGRIAIPVNNAAPCVEPWDGDDNGGATSMGVTFERKLK